MPSVSLFRSVLSFSFSLSPQSPTHVDDARLGGVKVRQLQRARPRREPQEQLAAGLERDGRRVAALERRGRLLELALDAHHRRGAGALDDAREGLFFYGSVCLFVRWLQEERAGLTTVSEAREKKKTWRSRGRERVCGPPLNIDRYLDGGHGDCHFRGPCQAFVELFDHGVGARCSLVEGRLGLGESDAAGGRHFGMFALSLRSSSLSAFCDGADKPFATPTFNFFF